jgi:NAD-dependent dihydropyrimidine dehydrogenase PreA subunit
MPLREIIRIDGERCDGCGVCIPACAEGAIAVVDGKARLVSESLCDGLGACLGHCPQGAITTERVDAPAFDEAAVVRSLRRLPTAGSTPTGFAACPGSRETSFDRPAPRGGDHSSPSALRQWPVQLHLVSPDAPYFHSADVLLAADCVAYAVGDFHRDHLAGRSLAIACPKLDAHQEIYLEKLVALIDDAEIASLTVMVMEVPCCAGLVRLAQAAAARAARKTSIRCLVVGMRGDILSDTTIPLVAGGTVTSLPVR